MIHSFYQSNLMGFMDFIFHSINTSQKNNSQTKIMLLSYIVIPIMIKYLHHKVKSPLSYLSKIYNNDIPEKKKTNPRNHAPFGY